MLWATVRVLQSASTLQWKFTSITRDVVITDEMINCGFKKSVM